MPVRVYMYMRVYMYVYLYMFMPMQIQMRTNMQVLFAAFLGGGQNLLHQHHELKKWRGDVRCDASPVPSNGLRKSSGVAGSVAGAVRRPNGDVEPSQ